MPPSAIPTLLTSCAPRSAAAGTARVDRYAQALAQLLDELAADSAHAPRDSVGGRTALELAKRREIGARSEEPL
jgi:hypothetical protein